MDARFRARLDAHAHLVREVGRCLTHGLRGHLNALDLNLALAEEAASATAPGVAALLPQALRGARDQVTRAGGATARVQALVTDAFAPEGMRIDLAARWAVALVAPLADDRRLRLEVEVDAGSGRPDDLPPAAAGVRELVALWLLHAARSAAPDGRLTVTVDRLGVGMTWTATDACDLDGARHARALAQAIDGASSEESATPGGTCTVRVRLDP